MIPNLTIFLFTDIDQCNSNPCKNGGKCIDGINDFLCICTKEYSGKDCSESKPEYREFQKYFLKGETHNLKEAMK